MLYTIIKKKTGGRNNNGRIITNIGGSAMHKRKYRFIDFKRIIKNQLGYVKRIEKDPNRSAFIALIYYTNGIFSYIIATENLRVGSIIYNYSIISDLSKNIFLSGNSFFIDFLPLGSIINNIELFPSFGACFVRSAGTSAKIIKKFNKDYTQIKLRSGEMRLIYNKCLVTLGIVSNINHHLYKLKKAGESRWLGIHPKVRGIAKNPVDHPHGGRTNKGMHPKTPSGKLAKFKPTRSRTRTNFFIITNRRKNRMNLS